MAYVQLKRFDGTNWISYDLKNHQFDIEVRSQAEFEALCNSPNWLGAHSVAFIGNGGNLVYTSLATITIPTTVTQIKGFNNAKIKVTNTIGLRYDVSTRPNSNDYIIEALTVECEVSLQGVATANAFSNCGQLINCTGRATASCLTSGTSATAYAFSNCVQLINCTGIASANGIGGTTTVASFYNSTQIANCIAIASGSGSLGLVAGLKGCSQITNCLCTISGSVTDKFGLYDCSWVNGCKKGNTEALTAFTGGSMLHVDTSTVVG